MKTKKLLIVVSIVFFAISFNAQAQRGMRGNAGQGACNIPGLTEEQQTQINELRTAQVSAATQHRAAMNELRAKKRSLSIAENPNMNEINSVIDQMESLRSAHLKSNAAHRQSVREILTPEQRVYFDSRHRNQGQGRGQGNIGRGDGRRGDARPAQGQRGQGRRW